MTEETMYTASQINRLRRRAQRAAEAPVEGPEGWSRSRVDPMRLLAAFPSLRLKEGLTLRAYQFREGGNGNGFVWAMPLGQPFPEPDECPSLGDRFLAPPFPPGALPHLMESMEGDGSPWSYLSASLFAREAAEFGAMWHGCDWSTHEIIDRAPWDETSRRDEVGGRATNNPEDWEWVQKQPPRWQPRVIVGDGGITVRFHTHSGLGRECLYHHVDTYLPGSYASESEQEVIAEGKMGYVF